MDSILPSFQAPPPPPDGIVPSFPAAPSPLDAPSPPEGIIPSFPAAPDPSPPEGIVLSFPAAPDPPSSDLPPPPPPKPRLPKAKFTSSKSGALMVAGAIALFFVLLWAGVALYRRHQRRRRQCSCRQRSHGDSPDVNAEGVQVPVEVQLAELPLASGSRQWESQMPEEHEDMPLASGGRHRSEIEELPPARSLSPHSPPPSASPLPEQMSEQAFPVSTHPLARNEPRRRQLVE